MRKTLLTGVVAASLLAPAISNAQPAPSSPRVEQSSTFDVPQWVVIGAVAVVGAAALDILDVGEIGYLALGAVGGYLFTVWYNGSGQTAAKPGASKT